MKQLGMLVFVMLITACGGGGGGPDTGAARSSDLVGAWEYTDPATQCVDTYTHNSDGTFNYRSLDETVVGTYELTANVGKYGRTLLALTATQDNALPDCEGVSDNDATGDTVDWYVETPADGELHFYAGASDTEVFAIFRR